MDRMGTEFEMEALYQESSMWCPVGAIVPLTIFLVPAKCFNKKSSS